MVSTAGDDDEIPALVERPSRANRDDPPPNTPQVNWEDLQGIYPPFEVIVQSLQDLGVSRKVKVKGELVPKHHFPEIGKLGKVLFENIRAKFPA